jgi:Sec-independent protein translocase protein TatA
MWEVALILMVALIVLGPKQLTETARVAGRIYRELMKMATDMRNSVNWDEMTRIDPPKPKPSTPASSGAITGDPKTGPDFYAELLESAKEGEVKDKQPTEDKQKAAEKDESPNNDSKSSGDEQPTKDLPKPQTGS